MGDSAPGAARVGPEETGPAGFRQAGRVSRASHVPQLWNGWRAGRGTQENVQAERVLGTQVVVDAMGWMRPLREGVQGEKRDDLG